MKTFKQFITESIEFDKDAWLRDYKDIITINSDGTIDVNGNVNLAVRRLEKLPFKFGKVTGFFDCSHNNLTSLEGSPRFVGSNFDCYYNDLTTLEGGPEFVGGYFDCSKNGLTTLKGSPNWVGGYFDCILNKLTSLDYLPEHIRNNIFAGKRFTKEEVEQAREKAIEKAKQRKYTKTLSYDDEVEGMGDIFD